jgi:hypothetical protein
MFSFFQNLCASCGPSAHLDVSSLVPSSVVLKQTNYKSFIKYSEAPLSAIILTCTT